MAWKDYRKERDRERRAARTPEQIEHDRKQDCEKARRYRERHRDALKEKRHTEVHRAKSRAISTRYRKKHLRPADYELKLASQNNLCALCGKPFDFSAHGTKPCYDHNHKTGQWREFIHSNCNTAIGLLDDDPALCRKAEEYLLRHKEAHDGTSGV